MPVGFWVFEALRQHGQRKVETKPQRDGGGVKQRTTLRISGSRGTGGGAVMWEVCIGHGINGCPLIRKKDIKKGLLFIYNSDDGMSEESVRTLGGAIELFK